MMHPQQQQQGGPQQQQGGPNTAGLGAPPNGVAPQQPRMPPGMPMGGMQMPVGGDMMSAAAVVEDEPLYVNAKQYHRILKRRAARAKLEEQNRISRQRKVSHASLCDPVSKHWISWRCELPRTLLTFSPTSTNLVTNMLCADCVDQVDAS